MIIALGHVVNSDADAFAKQVSKTVHEDQEKGLIVEIQYQPVGTVFSALIIGRKPT